MVFPKQLDTRLQPRIFVEALARRVQHATANPDRQQK
jgi:hypothetical protein